MMVMTQLVKATSQQILEIFWGQAYLSHVAVTKLGLSRDVILIDSEDEDYIYGRKFFPEKEEPLHWSRRKTPYPTRADIKYDILEPHVLTQLVSDTFARCSEWMESDYYPLAPKYQHLTSQVYLTMSEKGMKKYCDYNQIRAEVVLQQDAYDKEHS